MTKLKFLMSLHDRLSGLPQDEVEERLSFYAEMIEDRMEEGLSEEQAVAAVGTVDEVAAEIVADIPLHKIAKEKIKPKRQLRAWEIVLLVLGAPLWISLLAVALSVIITVYAVIWSLVAVLWSVFAALGSCALAGIVGGIIFVVTGNVATGIAMIGAALVCAGLCILLFFGCREATGGTVWLTKKIVLGIKSCFVKKEGAK